MNISSTPALTIGAATAPSINPDRARKVSESITVNATSHSSTVITMASLNHRTWGIRRRKSPHRNPREIEVHRIHRPRGSPSRCQDRVGNWWQIVEKNRARGARSRSGTATIARHQTAVQTISRYCAGPLTWDRFLQFELGYAHNPGPHPSLCRTGSRSAQPRGRFGKT